MTHFDALCLAMQAAQRAISVAREKAANEAKSEFMSLMCHEVRTPLNGCLASAEMLLEMPLQVRLSPPYITSKKIMHLLVHGICIFPIRMTLCNVCIIWSCSVLPLHRHCSETHIFIAIATPGAGHVCSSCCWDTRHFT